MTTTLSLGVVLIGGLAAERFAARYNIPAISSYMLLGIAMGPYALGLLDAALVGTSEILSNIVLGFIAFHIGNNFSIETFKRIGKAVIFISLAEATLAWCLVTIGMYFFGGQSLSIALMYGAISAATAPAATMMIVRQYRASGPFTDLLLGVVAIDDAWGIMVFSLSLSAAAAIGTGHIIEIHNIALLAGAVGKITSALLLGILAAYLVSSLSSAIKMRGDLLTFILGAVLINTEISMRLNLSPLLANISFGAALVNIDRTAFRFFDSLKAIDWPFYIIFYVLAGANLDVRLLPALGVIGLIYIIFRVIGKVAGAYLGGVLAGVPGGTRNYMGLALMPQAGVAVGLAMVAKSHFPQAGAAIFTTIVATTVIYEIFGPLATRYALSKMGEINVSTLD